MPTGVALRDAREQLFAAAERVLARDGVGALTSRAVTAEANVAKGVLHRHFADFDAFLAELVLDRIARLDVGTMSPEPGSGTVVDNLTESLVALFEPLAVAVVALVISRDGMRARLRAAGAARVPLVGEGTAHLRGYLETERELGRIARDADTSTLAATLTGAVHLLCTERGAAPPDSAEVRKVVSVVMGGVC